MEQQCAVIGVNAPIIPWRELEGSDAMLYFGLRVSQELDKAYQDGYRVFTVCIGTIVDLYLAFEVFGLKSEMPDVVLRTYDPDTLILGNMTEEQLSIREKLLSESNVFMMLGNDQTDRKWKKELVSKAGRVIAATASFCDPAAHFKAAVYSDIPGEREFIEIPLIHHIKLDLIEKSVD